MVNDPSGKDPQDPDMNPHPHTLEGALEDDPFITETFGSLEEIRVPSEFLPNVMFQVYERHHRNKLSWRKVILISLTLLMLALVFFIWDSFELMTARGFAGFGEALDFRLDRILLNAELFFSALGNVLSAGWQLVLGTLREAPFTLFLTLVILVTTAWLARKVLLSILR